MAFTYDGVLVTRASAATSPITTTLTVSASTLVVCLMIKGVGATARAGGAPTWNGQTFTQANSTQLAAASPEASAEMWYLLNPGAGSTTLSIPNTGSITCYYEVSGASASVGSTAQFEAANGGNATSSNPTPGATNISLGGIGFGFTAGGWQNFSSATSSLAGAVLIGATPYDDGAHGGGSQYYIEATAAGSVTIGWTFGTSDDWGAVAATFKEVPLPSHNIEFLKYVSAPDGISVGEKGLVGY